MATAVLGAVAKPIGDLLTGTITAGIKAGTDRANVKDTLNNNLELQKLRGTNNLDVQGVVNRGMTDVKTIEGKNMYSVADLQTSTSKYLQQQQLDQYKYVRENLQKSLTDAGLPSYLAYIQPDESLMQTRQVRGLNFAQYYPGQKYRRGIM